MIQAVLVLAAVAASASPADVEFFESKVRPVLAGTCVRCHGPEGAQAQFPLETLAQLEGYMEVPAGVTVPEAMFTLQHIDQIHVLKSASSLQDVEPVRNRLTVLRFDRWEVGRRTFDLVDAIHV